MSKRSNKVEKIYYDIKYCIWAVEVQHFSIVLIPRSTKSDLDKSKFDALKCDFMKSHLDLYKLPFIDLGVRTMEKFKKWKALAHLYLLKYIIFYYNNLFYFFSPFAHPRTSFSHTYCLPLQPLCFGNYSLFIRSRSRYLFKFMAILIIDIPFPT